MKPTTATFPPLSFSKHPPTKTFQGELRFEHRLNELIKDHMGQHGLSATRLAESLNMSRRHLQRKIKDIYGTTPHQYIQDQKMSLVKEMIDDGRISLVSEAAEYAGYAKVAHFSKIFKIHFKTTPSEYIRMITWRRRKNAQMSQM